MKAVERIDENTAKDLGKKLNVSFDSFDLEEFEYALNLELEAGVKGGEIRPDKELKERDLEGIGRVALAHINTFSE